MNQALPDSDIQSSPDGAEDHLPPPRLHSRVLKGGQHGLNMDRGELLQAMRTDCGLQMPVHDPSIADVADRRMAGRAMFLYPVEPRYCDTVIPDGSESVPAALLFSRRCELVANLPPRFAGENLVDPLPGLPADGEVPDPFAVRLPLVDRPLAVPPAGPCGLAPVRVPSSLESALDFRSFGRADSRRFATVVLWSRSCSAISMSVYPSDEFRTRRTPRL